MEDNMKPVDVGAPKLIPQGNLTSHPASYAGLRSAVDSAWKSKGTKTRSSAYPNFIPGYYGASFTALKGEWQSSTI